MPSKEHRRGLKEFLEKLEKKGMTVVNLNKGNIYPDGLVVDWKKKRVFAVEIEVTQKTSYNSIKERIMSKYHGVKGIIPLIVIVRRKDEPFRFDL